MKPLVDAAEGSPQQRGAACITPEKHMKKAESDNQTLQLRRATGRSQPAPRIPPRLGT
jgi:hypothetical protein